MRSCGQSNGKVETSKIEIGIRCQGARAGEQYNRSEAQVEADQLVAATRAALAADSDMLDASARHAIDDAIGDVLRARDEGELQSLVAAVGTLNHATAEFAARRMNRGVARALTGRSIDALT